ncbi:MAG: amino acid adenylation domain-containing protein [Gammaproteobacteria bacterium]
MAASSGRRLPLSAAKQALLQRYLRGEVGRGASVISKRGAGPIPLSYQQHRLWVLEQLSAGSGAYHISAAYRLRGVLDIEALSSAFSEVARRHEVLRTRIDATAPEPQQLVDPAVEVDIGVSNLGARSEGEALKQLEADAARPFDLATGPLWRVRLWELSKQGEESEYLLLFVCHHIVFDGCSTEVLFRELAALYGAYRQGKAPPLAELPIQYTDYAPWQRRWLSGERLQRELEHWRARLEGTSGVLDLPTDQVRPPLASYRGASHDFSLSAEIGARLKALARQERVTPFVLLLTVFKTLLYRYSAQHDLCIGTPVANRLPVETEELIGCFVNTVVLRTPVSGQMRFKEHLLRVRQACVEAQAHQQLPFDRLLEALGLARDTSRNPLVQVMFTFHEGPRHAMALAGLTVAPVALAVRSAQFDLALEMRQTTQGLQGSLIYATDLYVASTASRIAQCFQCLLASVVAQPDARLCDLPLLGDKELNLLQQWNVSYPGACVPQLIEAQAARAPDVTAIVFAGEQLSYTELNRRANRLARHLRALGVGPDAIVGVCLARSIELVVSLLAVLKAGGAYLPLEPEYPAERLAYMLRDAGAVLVLTTSELRIRLPEGATPCLCLDEQVLSTQAEENLEPLAIPPHLAYVIYTSGSSGRPKGVAVPHQGLSNRILWMQDYFALVPSDVVLQKTPFGFDVSVWEFFWPLTIGACLALARPGEHREPERLIARIQRERVTTLHFVPSMLAALLESQGHLGDSVRRVVCSGEALSAALAAQFFQTQQAGLYNLYGPTEASIDVSVFACRPDPARGGVPIGRPIANTQLYILDQVLNPVPVGLPGELYIGGAGLARGYLGRPSLTAERFVPNPLGEPSTRLYKTGDRARYLSDGNIEFLGRLDAQVKIRGNRIELGEVEARLLEYADVRQACVIAQAGGSGGSRLVAYVVMGDSALDAEALKRHLAATLPEYMLPSAFIALEALPISSNGKLDRKALPAPESAPCEPTAAPRNTLECRLLAIWVSVLGLEQIGIHDNFFALGGDSIGCIQVVSRTRQSGLLLSTRDLFEHPTIAALAKAVRLDIGAMAKQGPVSGPVPLTPIQCWFFDQALPNPHHWNQAVLLTVRADITPAILERAAERLIVHHDALRHRFVFEDGQWRQACLAADAAPAVGRVDLSWVPSGERSTAIEALASEWHGRLRLDEGPLLHMIWMDLGETYRLLVIIHHLVVDGVSWRILLEDLEAACRQILAGKPVCLADESASFKRWSERLRGYADSGALQPEIPYWRGLAAKTMQPLPVDNPQGANVESCTKTVAVSLDPEATRWLLRDALPPYRLQVADLILTALAQVLGAWSASRVIALDLEGHGREELFPGLDSSRTIGWFTTLFPVRLEIPADPSPCAALKAIKEQLRGIPSKGIGYGLLHYLRGRGELAMRPAQVRFNYLGQWDQTLARDSLFAFAAEPVGRCFEPTGTRAYELDVTAFVVCGQLRIEWRYGRSRHRRDTVSKLAADLLLRLRGLLAHCMSPQVGGYTPSDFPLAGLAQADLDRLAAAEPGISDIYPLTSLQQGMVFHSEFSPESGAYVQQMSCVLRGALDVRVFRAAWQHVFNHHAMLRTEFLLDGVATPLQVVRERVNVPLALQDWRTLSKEAQGAQWNALLQADQAQGFAYARPPLARLMLVQTQDRRYRFLWSHHHALLDGWCVGLILGEVFQAYNAIQRGEVPRLTAPRPYRDYVAYLLRQDQDAARAFWRSIFAGFDSPAALGIGEKASAAAGGSGYAERSVDLSHPVTQRLVTFAKQHGLTLNTVLQGAWAVLLGRYSGEREVVFGVTVSGRPAELPGVESMIGLFINTLPLRVELPPGERIVHWLARLMRQNAELRQYEHTPLVDLRRLAEVPGRQPLFESIVVFENQPWHRALPSHGLEIEHAAFSERTHYPLTLVGVPGDAMSIRMAYDTSRFADEVIERLLAHFETLLQEIVQQPEALLSALSLMPAHEMRRLAAGNATGWPPPEGNIVSWFEEKAQEAAETLAVECEGERLSYGELNRLANRVATGLIERGIGGERLVAVAADPTVERVIVLLGILKSGAAYVPLEPEQPKRRWQEILEEARPDLVLVSPEHTGKVPEGWACAPLDSGLSAFARQAEQNPAVPIAGEQLAYVLYTSGSTGKPKGVAVRHAGLSNRVSWGVQRFGWGPRDRVLQHTVLGFDVAGWEIWGALVAGARLVIANEKVQRDPERLVDRMMEQGVTWMEAVPSLLQALLEVSGFDQCRRLRGIGCGGEALSGELQRRVRERLPWVGLYNLYGPTEVTIDATLWTCGDDGEPVPIGRPISNAQAYLLDRDLNAAPVGVAGELYIGGAGLARGYLRRPEFTAERFLPNPFGPPGTRLYRTGDRGRYRADGAIEFLGRIDHQIKLRGYRIELGEVEARLCIHPAVKEACAVLSEAEHERRLVAYVVAEGVSADELRRYLSEHLPGYMLPAAFVFLPTLPLTPAGKRDRKALPAPGAAMANTYAAPRNLSEQSLAEVWADVLGLARVGIHDNFFDLGGHSLTAMQVIARIRHVFRREVALRALFDAPTVAALAAKMVCAAGEIQGSLPAIRAVSRGRSLRLSFAQQRLWFLHQMDPRSAAYNVPLAFRFRGRLDLAALESAINEVVDRHEVLRTVFLLCGDEPMQRIQASCRVPLAVTDLRHLPEQARWPQAKDEVRKAAELPFDLAVGPVLRVRLWCLGQQTGEEEHLLFWVCHHVCFDGWSADVLARELIALYHAFETGRPSPLALPPIQYADYAQWQRQWLSGARLEKELAYWKAQLAGASGVVDLPTDRVRPALLGSRGASYRFFLSAGLTLALRRLGRTQGVTPFMVLMAAFKTLLHCYSGQRDLIVGTPVANRTALETEGLIGCFVNMLVLRTRVKEDDRFLDLLEQVRDVCLSAQAHQQLPFERLVEALRLARDMSRNPLVQVTFQLQHAAVAAVSEPALIPVELSRTSAQFELSLDLAEAEGGLQATFEYNADLFNAGTIEAMAGRYAALLQQVIDYPAIGLSDLAELSVPIDARVKHRSAPPFTRTPRPDRAAPRNLFEQRMVELWARALGKSRLSIHDDFFELGGYSLLAFRLVQRIREEFGTELSLAAFFQGPTIAELVSRLLSGPDGGNASLITLRDGPAHRPLYCMHTGTGHARDYRPLVAGLGCDRKVYGVPLPAFVDPGLASRSMDVLAGGYAASLRRETPSKPYILIGWSLGGLIALAVAGALERMGETLAFVGLIDTDAPDPAGDWRQRFAPYLHESAERARLKALAPCERRELEIELQALPEEAWSAHVAAWGRARGYWFNDISPELLRMDVALWRHIEVLEDSFTPPCLRAPLHVWWARDSLDDRGCPPTDWSACTSAGVHVQVVDGNHGDIIRNPDLHSALQHKLDRIPTDRTV